MRQFGNALAHHINLVHCFFDRVIDRDSSEGVVGAKLN